jgi:hypothetical protein
VSHEVSTVDSAAVALAQLLQQAQDQQPQQLPSSPPLPDLLQPKQQLQPLPQPQQPHREDDLKERELQELVQGLPAQTVSADEANERAVVPDIAAPSPLTVPRAMAVAEQVQLPGQVIDKSRAKDLSAAW